MSKTWRREHSNPHPPIITADEEDEDTDPRSYNVIQRYSQERNPGRLEKALSDRSEALGMFMWDD